MDDHQEIAPQYKREGRNCGHGINIQLLKCNLCLIEERIQKLEKGEKLTQVAFDNVDEKFKIFASNLDIFLDRIQGKNKCVLCNGSAKLFTAPDFSASEIACPACQGC